MNKKSSFTLKVYRGKPTNTNDFDLSKRWYVECNYYNEATGTNRRELHYISSSLKTKEQRERESRIIIRKLKSTFAGMPGTLKKHRGHVLFEALDSRKPFLRHKGYLDYESKVRLFLQWCDYKDVRYISPVDAYNFITHLKTLERQNTTVNNYVITLAMLFDVVNKLYPGKKKNNPFAGIKALPEDKKSLQRFRDNEIPVVLKAISDKDKYLLLAVMIVYYCFIRPRSELRRLQIKNFDFSEKKLFVPGTKSKNKKSQYVSIPQPLLDYMIVHGYHRQKPDYFIIGKGGPPGPVQIGENTQGNYHMQVMRELGYNNEYGMYSWKHTGVWRAVKSGMNIKEVQTQLRHHSLDETSEYLKNLGLEDMPNVQERFPALPSI